MKIFYPPGIRRLGVGIIPSRLEILLGHCVSLERAYEMSKSYSCLKELREIKHEIMKQLGDEE